MRYLAIILVLAAFPVFMGLLQSNAYRKWAFVALGALPILYAPLNLDGSFIAWPHWDGYVRGLILTAADPLALLICLRYGRGRPTPPLLWAFAVYFVCLLPAMLTGYFLPALFVIFQMLRVGLFFYAVYLAVLGGQLMRVAEGLAIAVIVSGAMSSYQALSGAFQAPGVLGHQNLTGLATNLCVPVLLALGLTTKRPLFLLAVAAGAVGAVAGGSRATIIFYAFSVFGTLAAAVLIKPTGKTLAIAAVAVLGLAAASPMAIEKLNERNVAGFEKDGERIAFEKTADLMIADHPWGAGLNQFVSEANTSGYFDRAGVRWGVGARSTNVHNTYMLIWAEAGLLGLIGLLVWLLSPIWSAASALFRKRMPAREVSVACGFAVTGAALHSQFEWITMTATPQYLLALMAGTIAAVAAHAARAAQTPAAPRPVEAAAPNPQPEPQGALPGRRA